METSLRSAAVPLLSGPFLAISALLAVAGATKIVRPKYTVGALRAAGLPASNSLVRLLGLAEVGAGIAAIWTGASLWAGAIGIFYLGFALFVIYALRSGIPIASCGCFGSPDTPPNVGHVVLDLTATAVALAVAIDPIGSWVGLPGVETMDRRGLSPLFGGHRLPALRNRQRPPSAIEPESRVHRPIVADQGPRE